MRRSLILLFTLISTLPICVSAQSFVTAKDGKLYADGKPYYYVGTNYWYGSLLGLEKNKERGIKRLRKELDFLKKQGITNLRIMGGAEGSGQLNGVNRVGPAFQYEHGKFDDATLKGLDILLDEMAKRKMRAVIFVSNNWEWSGGFQQYLIWNNVISKEWLTQKPDWDTLRDLVAKFYSCAMCKYGYAKQAARLVRRVNSVNGKQYREDPTIMSWQIANEPRPMRPAAIDEYKKWIALTAEQFKRLAPKQLVSVGHEGWIGSEGMEVYESIHADKNVDYLTIHIWPKNWAWFENGKMADQYDKAEALTVKYIDDHLALAEKLNKPLVIEEFGMPRDGQSFDISAKTAVRDRYFAKVLSYVKTKPNVAGANFWAFGGTARPIKGQLFWKLGDQYMGDPPMEEQGLYTVFDLDRSTWKTIRSVAANIAK